MRLKFIALAAAILGCGFSASPAAAVVFTFDVDVTSCSGNACPGGFTPFSYSPSIGFTLGPISHPSGFTLLPFDVTLFPPPPFLDAAVAAAGLAGPLSSELGGGASIADDCAVAAPCDSFIGFGAGFANLVTDNADGTTRFQVVSNRIADAAHLYTDTSFSLSSLVAYLALRPPTWNLIGRDLLVAPVDPLNPGQGSVVVQDNLADFGGAARLVAVDGVPVIAPGTTTVVPEPATWALMIAGFGLAGVALRRRSRVA